MTRTPYEIALGELGVTEAKGKANNPRILEYAEKAGIAGYENDSEAWCAVFVNFCLAEAGFPGTRSKMARSFEGYGKRLASPKKGCIVVLERGSDPRFGHVGFYDHESNEVVYVLGGNQSDSVSIAPYSLSRVVCYREPHDRPATLNRPALTTIAVGTGAAASEVVQSVPIVPSVPQPITDAVSSVSAWQNIGDTLWAFQAWAVSQPLLAALLLALIGFLALYRPSAASPAEPPPSES